MGKVYAVRRGRAIGVFDTWAEAKTAVDGFPAAEYRSFKDKETATQWLEGVAVPSGKYYGVQTGAEGRVFASWDECSAFVKGKPFKYKSFKTAEEAEDFASGRVELKANKPIEKEFIHPEYPTFYIDGSRVKDHGIGYGIYLVDGKNTYKFRGRVDGSMGNITGELAAFIETYKFCRDCVDKGKEEYKQINLVYDYEGVKNWLDDTWRVNKPEVKLYRAFYDRMQADTENMLTIAFYWVKGHTGVTGNAEADKLARAGALLAETECRPFREIIEV